MPCLVHCYDCLRAWCNPKSISHKPWTKHEPDVHEYYYGMFLSSGSAHMDSDTYLVHASLKALHQDLKTFINKNNAGPILIRIAWHDSGTFDQRIKSWPECGGANGAIIHEPEMSFGANAGLTKARAYLKEFKDKYPAVSWADLIQMASATAVECMGGPKIDMKYGRVDVPGPEACVPGDSREGFKTHAGLPDAMPPFGCGAKDAATHLRNVFSKKMGFTDKDIVALSGAHTVGRAFKDRSGACPFGYANPSKYTKDDCIARHDNRKGVGMPGGCSWTKNWLTFDNSYYKDYKVSTEDKDLLWFPTDAALHEDPEFNKTFQLFAKDQKEFFKAYAAAHKKLSELGSKFSPEKGITL
mmetsp:Transcript_2141/g.4930  ORF Transcript_2141/g.4930 Transcript_2141/m.4930 type:complete len:356 (+) Transcript_2141:88-1155(+)|eukprot:CAMPEP_0170637206 /NCGR_PEP_ID=MMETSP0224-20130122/38268_1 /TAXON_ID=285029 /ORGANISM="Togula jolla, Strain CCCM 725" /LENGTH=355 /DNA_ID=CAMNT_0010967031 /DNA_START=67 /DNA_END=1134 /DNA_ORIENTATION=-